MANNPDWFLRKVSEKKLATERTLYILAALTLALQKYNIKPILVGGGALEFYTFGNYATHDIDLVADERHLVGEALETLGFSHEPGFRHWYHEDLDVSIEIPDTKLAGSYEKVTSIDVHGVLVQISSPEDLLIDRLAAYKFWKSLSDGEWAARLYAIHGNNMDLKYLEERANSEQVLDVLKEVMKRSKESKKSG
jgi:hypothetical protein